MSLPWLFSVMVEFCLLLCVAAADCCPLRLCLQVTQPMCTSIVNVWHSWLCFSSRGCPWCLVRCPVSPAVALHVSMCISLSARVVNWASQFWLPSVQRPLCALVDTIVIILLAAISLFWTPYSHIPQHTPATIIPMPFPACHTLHLRLSLILLTPAECLYSHILRLHTCCSFDSLATKLPMHVHEALLSLTGVMFSSVFVVRAPSCWKFSFVLLHFLSLSWLVLFYYNLLELFLVHVLCLLSYWSLVVPFCRPALGGKNAWV